VRSVLADCTKMAEHDYWEECAVTRHDNGRVRLFARSLLVQGMKMAEHNYLQGVCWHKARQWKRATFREECAGGRSGDD
jgi:hypothetical protein